MTLVETLIGALIFAFVTAGVYMMYTTMQNTMSRGELMSDLQQNARIGLAQMVQEIRMAGYDPSGISPLVILRDAPQGRHPVRHARVLLIRGGLARGWHGQPDHLYCRHFRQVRTVSPAKSGELGSGNKVFKRRLPTLAGGTLVN